MVIAMSLKFLTAFRSEVTVAPNANALHILVIWIIWVLLLLLLVLSFMLLQMNGNVAI